MRTLTYADIAVTDEHKANARTLVDRVKDKMETKYSASRHYSWDITVEFQLEKILALLPNLPNGNPRILDLGCGSRESPDNPPGSRAFEPWLCRVLHELGVKTVGIDLKGLDAEEFEHYHIDLRKPNALARFVPSSFDMAFASRFLNSLFLTRDRGNLYGHDLKDKLAPELERIVKPEGFFVYCGSAGA